MESEVNHPRHYNIHPGGIECIEVVRHFNFNLGNVIKYLWRAGLKPGASQLEDLNKALWYLKDEIERVTPRPKVETAWVPPWDDIHPALNYVCVTKFGLVIGTVEKPEFDGMVWKSEGFRAVLRGIEVPPDLDWKGVYYERPRAE